MTTTHQMIYLALFSLPEAYAPLQCCAVFACGAVHVPSENLGNHRAHTGMVSLLCGCTDVDASDFHNPSQNCTSVTVEEPKNSVSVLRHNLCEI